MNKIKTITFNGNLYRANKTDAKKGKSAANNYKGAPIKYFTLNKSELSAYTKKGTTYKKTWNANNLTLVDILDLETRQELEKKFKNEELKKSLRTAFPISDRKVSRKSNSETTIDDYAMLKELCRLGYDGYYMKTINEFHSEVGLCPKVFDQLKLRENAEEVRAPINIKRKSKKNYISYNINNIPRGTLFNMSGNITNNMPNLIQKPKTLKRHRENNNSYNTRKKRRLSTKQLEL